MWSRSKGNPQYHLFLNIKLNHLFLLETKLFDFLICSSINLKENSTKLLFSFKNNMYRNSSKLLICNLFLNRVGAWVVGKMLQKCLWSRAAKWCSFSDPKTCSCIHCQLCRMFIHIPKQRQNLHLFGKISIISFTVDTF